MDTDHDQPVGPVAVEPRPDVGKGALAVDARVRPEVVQDDFAPEVRLSERSRIDPGVGIDRRSGRTDLQVGGVHRSCDLAGIGVCTDEHCGDGDRDQNPGRNQVASISTPTSTRSALYRTRVGRHHVECKEHALGPGGRLDCRTKLAYAAVGACSRTHSHSRHSPQWSRSPRPRSPRRQPRPARAPPRSLRPLHRACG